MWFSLPRREVLYTTSLAEALYQKNTEVFLSTKMVVLPRSLWLKVQVFMTWQ